MPYAVFTHQIVADRIEIRLFIQPTPDFQSHPFQGEELSGFDMDHDKLTVHFRGTMRIINLFQ